MPNSLVSLRDLTAAGVDFRADALTRRLYATDASIYQVEPAAVAFPRSPGETGAIVQAAAADSLSVIPRGAGTGLVGGAIGDGLVIDQARYNRRISQLDVQARTVQVEAGVVLDQLNAYLRPHGLRFGPDVATSSRATLGGMIANNSSGSHVPVYGTTIDHVRAIDLVLADGRQATIGEDAGDLELVHARVSAILESCRTELDARMPDGMLKRWPGYGIEDWLRQGPSLAWLIGGSEGTLGIITGAQLALRPLPTRKGLGVVSFATVTLAMQAAVELLDLHAAAIEHIDRVLFEQTRGQLAFRKGRALLGLDETPCEAILLVEFFDEVDAPLAELRRRNLGLRTRTFTAAEDMDAIWNVRKAGLSLVTSCIGPAKPVTGIEDTCVRPRDLASYVQALYGLLRPLGLEASFYGHAAAGLLHVRPVLDLHSADDLRKFRKLGDEVSAIVKQFNGSISAEHGVGIARTEYVATHLGPVLTGAMRDIKAAFDPDNLFNPGKIVHDGRYRFDNRLRWGAGYEIKLPFEPKLEFAFKDRSFVGNLEQCNGCGGCRKDTPTMCPTYIVTGEEIMSTRGRANVIRAVLDGTLDGGLESDELGEALSNCLSCKACTTECPSNVNLALLKTALLHAKHARTGLSLRDRMLSRVDLIGQIGSRVPGLANATLSRGLVRRAMQRSMGLAAQRPLPKFARERFDEWFARRRRVPQGRRGKVVLWDDCFTRYYEPEIGIAAVQVLEAAGFEPVLPANRACCGRPAFSLGRLDLAEEWAEHNANLLARVDEDTPIVFLEPSCFSMIHDDYRELDVLGSDKLRERAHLLEQFLGDVLDKEPLALRFKPTPVRAAVHTHCHTKALAGTAATPRVLRRVPGCEAQVLDTACCGMAGAFGALAEKYDLSMKLGALLAGALETAPADAFVIASGTSCRQQIEHMTNRRPLHVAEFLAMALEPTR